MSNIPDCKDSNVDIKNLQKQQKQGREIKEENEEKMEGWLEKKKSSS